MPVSCSTDGAQLRRNAVLHLFAAADDQGDVDWVFASERYIVFEVPGTFFTHTISRAFLSELYIRHYWHVLMSNRGDIAGGYISS